MDLGIKRNKKPSIYASDKCVLYTLTFRASACHKAEPAKLQQAIMGINYCRVCFFATFFVQYSIPVLEIMMLNLPCFEKP